MTTGAPALPWFRVAELEPGVHLVAEPGHISCWLVRGAERSVLIDTGLGVASIAEAVRTVEPGRVTVITSHGHFDHVGGNHEFAERLVHEAGAETVREPVPADLLRAYWEGCRELRPGWESLLRADRDSHAFLIGPDEEVRPWPPPGLDEGDWRIEPPAPTGTLRDGDVVELGDRSLRVIHTPGHAHDHVCLLDERAGILFAQDQAYYGPHFLDFDGADVEAWARSARRLADDVAPSIRVVYCAHCLRPAVPPRLLGELADAGAEVAAGEARLVPTVGFWGEPRLAADYGHFSLVLPLSARRSGS